MRHFLLLACVSAISLGATGAQAEPLQYSRPVAGTLLAQAPVEGAPGSAQFATLCRKQCEQTFTACHKQNANDKSCSSNYSTCIQSCH